MTPKQIALAALSQRHLKAYRRISLLFTNVLARRGSASTWLENLRM
jgi:hypothetical protein